MKRWLVLLVMGILLGLARPAAAQPSIPCPTRSSLIDVMKDSLVLNDVLLILQTGSTIALAQSWWGRPAAVATALANGVYLATVGLATIDYSFDALQSSLPREAARSGQSLETVQARADSIRDLVANNWMMRVGGASLGGLTGLFVPFATGSRFGAATSVLLSTAAATVVGGLWHRLALWPFADTTVPSCSGGSKGE